MCFATPTARDDRPRGVRRLALLSRRRRGDQRASALPGGTSGIALSASVVVGGDWRLGGPGPYGPAIGDAVRVVVAMAEMGWPGARKISGRSRGGGTRRVFFWSVAERLSRSGTPLWRCGPGLQERG